MDYVGGVKVYDLEEEVVGFTEEFVFAVLVKKEGAGDREYRPVFATKIGSDCFV